MNRHPIRDWYAVEVVRGADGELAIRTKCQIASAYGDAHAAPRRAVQASSGTP